MSQHLHSIAYLNIQNHLTLVERKRLPFHNVYNTCVSNEILILGKSEEEANIGTVGAYDGGSPSIRLISVNGFVLLITFAEIYFWRRNKFDGRAIESGNSSNPLQQRRSKKTNRPALQLRRNSEQTGSLTTEKKICSVCRLEMCSFNFPSFLKKAAHDA